MKHKFLTVMLALVAVLCLCFGLAACGEETPQDPSGEDDLWTAERLYDEAKALGFEGSFDDLVALFKGADGKDGRNGVGIASAKIDENGHLQITLTDGNVLDAGVVSGAPAQAEGTEGLAYHMRRSPTGEETLEVVGMGIAYDLDIVIPATYRGIPVTAIADRAFYDHSDLTSISIPDSVTLIGSRAFYNCNGLTGVYITDLAAWCKIDFGGEGANPLEYAHHLYLDNVEVKNLTIPTEIKEIKQYAFYGCSGLESVTIGSGVTSMGDGAFSGCNGLTGVYITDLAAWCKIDFEAEGFGANPLVCAHHLYLDGVEVRDLTIPAEITEIKQSAFLSCSGLTSVTIGSSVTSIGYVAFSGCSGLTGTLNIPDGVTSIGENAFSFCSGLESVTIGKDVTSIGLSAFWSCTGLTSVTIGENVSSIGISAFAECTRLTSISIPDSVTLIGDRAFSACSGLTSVTFENPNGWSANGTALLSDALQNATTAAEYLCDLYRDYTWTRN